MKLDQEKRQFNDVLGYLHREIFTCEVHLKQVEKDLIGFLASKVMQVKRATRNSHVGWPSLDATRIMVWVVCSVDALRSPACQ